MLRLFPYPRRRVGLLFAALLALAPASATQAQEAAKNTAPRLHVPAGEARLQFVASGRPEPLSLAPTEPLSGAPNDLAKAFADLVFGLERGSRRRALPKWPQPISVFLEPALEPGFGGFLAIYLEILRANAKIQIARETPGRNKARARIAIRLAPTFAMMRRLGGSFCIATPGDLDWDAFERRLDGGDPNAPRWATLTRPIAATIFVPDRARPHQIRGCLMEEILQALGPAGDYFALTQSIFNDDGARSAPTAFDLLMLRVLYDPALERGMSEDAAELAARVVISRELGNFSSPPRQAAHSDRDADWLKHIRMARAQRHPQFAEQVYARAARHARDFGADDPRGLFTAFERARNRARFEPAGAFGDFTKILTAYQRLFGGRGLYTALVELERAKTALSLNRFELAENLALAARPVLAAHHRDDAVAEAILVRAAARERARQIHTDQKLTGSDALWRDYAFGVPRNFRAEIPKPAAAASGSTTNAALPVALIAMLAPILVFGALIWRALRSGPAA